MPCDLLKLERWTTNSTQYVLHCFCIFFHPTPLVLSSDWWNVKFAHIIWLKSSVLHRNRGGSCSVKILRNNLCYSSSKYYILIVFQITVSVCSQWMNSGSSCLRFPGFFLKEQKRNGIPVFRSCRSGETSYRFLEGFLLQQPTSSSLVWRFPLIEYLYISHSLQVLAIRKFDLFDSGFNRNNLILPDVSVTCHYTIGGCIGRRVFIDWLNFLDRRE